MDDPLTFAVQSHRTHGQTHTHRQTDTYPHPSKKPTHARTLAYPAFQPPPPPLLDPHLVLRHPTMDRVDVAHTVLQGAALHPHDHDGLRKRLLLGRGMGAQAHNSSTIRRSSLASVCMPLPASHLRLIAPECCVPMPLPSEEIVDKARHGRGVEHPPPPHPPPTPNQHAPTRGLLQQRAVLLLQGLHVPFQLPELRRVRLGEAGEGDAVGGR